MRANDDFSSVPQANDTRTSSVLTSMVSRDGTTKRSVFAKTQSTPGLSGEIQHSDPGGLRRRSLSWKTEQFFGQIGDLSAWADHPLLEGTSLQSGKRDTSLDRQILYGSGTHPNGLDLNASWNDLHTRSRQRWEMAANGRAKGSSTVLAQYGPVCAGVRVSDSDNASSATHLFLLGFQNSLVQVDGTILELPSTGVSSAVFARIDQGREESDLEVKFRHVSKDFVHDGLPAHWAGTTAALVKYTREIARRTKLSAQVDGFQNTLGMVGARVTSQASAPVGKGLSLRLRTEIAENDSAASRWSVGLRATGNFQGLSPYVEAVFCDSSQNQKTTGIAGASFRKGDQEFSASTSVSTNSGPNWMISHKTTAATTPANLEFTLSANGSLRQGTALVAQGSLACLW